MPAITGTFPFGGPLRPVVQVDRGPKDMFVLGVYRVLPVAHPRQIAQLGKSPERRCELHAAWIEGTAAGAAGCLAF